MYISTDIGSVYHLQALIERNNSHFRMAREERKESLKEQGKKECLKCSNRVQNNSLQRREKTPRAVLETLYRPGRCCFFRFYFFFSRIFSVILSIMSECTYSALSSVYIYIQKKYPNNNLIKSFICTENDVMIGNEDSRYYRISMTFSYSNRKK